MVNKFQIIDTVRKHYPASQQMAERTNHLLICLDQGECPMRQLPQYVLDEAQGEVEKYSGGQLNGKSVKIEVREMNGRGNPQMRGRIVEVLNNGTK